MDVREKLAEIVCNVMESDGCIGHCNHPPCFEVERVVNALIAHGVTVQEWVPVTERTPENIGLYLVIEKHWLDGSSGVEIAKWNNTDWFTADRKSKEITPRVTHWMPMPKQPKKGANVCLLGF